MAALNMTANIELHSVGLPSYFDAHKPPNLGGTTCKTWLKMLIIVLIFALIRTLQGLPLSLGDDPEMFSLSSLGLRDTQITLGERSVNDIIISCFATIFACTWSAIHPNIPAPTDCWWTRFKRQVTTMLCALLAPEFITAWALRQHLAARSIMNEYNKQILKDSDIRNPDSVLDIVRKLFLDSPLPSSSDRGPRWTLAHGFFLQMGGFMLSEGGRPIHTLNGKRKASKNVQLIYNIQEGVIDPPRITEEDIEDRSKGDAVSKTVILLQTTWFIVQCIARWSQHLPVTELEVVMLGFAMLNGITYALWWHKPQNVGRPVFLERKKSQAFSMKQNILARVVSVSESESKAIIDNCSQGDLDPPIDPRDETTRPTLCDPTPCKESWLRQKLRVSIARKSPWALPIIVPFHLLLAFLRPLLKFMEGVSIPDVGIRHQRVPMFYTASETEMEDASQIAIAVIGVLFGSVHLIPSWFLEFSSPVEMWLWWASAIDITGVPLLMLLGVYLHTPLRLNEWPWVLFVVFLIPFSIIVFLYPISRIVLIILSLTSLRSLPPAALQTIEWTTFIPHL